MADVLGFVLEDVDDFVAEVQRSFGVQLTSDQLRNCYTFEDLHQLLLASVPNSERLDAGCLGAKAFFRLKRAIEGTDGNGKLMPRTPLSSLTAGCQAYKWLDALERQTGIKMPHTIITQLGCLVMLLTLGLSSLALYAANVHHVLVWMIVLPLSLWLGGLMAHKYFSVFPRGMTTLGDLARGAAALNVAALSSQGGVVRKREMRAALEWMLRDRFVLKGPLNWGTRFFPEKN